MALTLVLCAALLAGVFSACQLPDTRPYLAPEQEDTTSHQNPFAAPLLEYFEGGIETPQGREMERAFWVDITGDGNIGVGGCSSVN